VRSTSTELAHAVLQIGGRDLRAELNGKVPLTGSTRDVGVRGRQAPWVVTKEVGKRRRRSPADAAPETSPFCKFDRDLPRFLRISFARSISSAFPSDLFFFGRQATGNGGTPSSVERLKEHHYLTRHRYLKLQPRPDGVRPGV
jgi:hypothetical protein